MPLPQRQEPPPSLPRPGPGPELVPPKRPRRRVRWALAALIAGGLGAAIWWQLRTAPQTGGPGGGAAPGIPTAVVENRRIERVLRLTGTTAAERYVNIVSPRLRGSRSRRGLQTGGRVGIAANVTVRSTSSVATQATMSSLSQTGVVASSSAAAARGGGVAGAGGGAQSARLQAATSRVRTGGSGSTGNVQLSGSAGVTAMGASGLGSTANFLTGGSSGPPARRRRGDFHLQLQRLAPAGTRVKRGDIIAVFDRQYMLTRLDDYAAAVAMHKANYEKSRAEIEVKRKAHTESVEAARAGLEKAELDIKTIPVLSAIQAERTRLAREEAEAEYRRRLEEIKFQRVSEEAELRQAELEMREAEVELRRAQNNAEKLVVRALMDGMVVLLDVFRHGEFGKVKEGDELWSGQPFLQVVDLSSMIVKAKVNQLDVEEVRIGQRARVRFDAFPDLELPARVYSIGTVAKARRYRPDYVREVPVILKLERTDPRVIPDLSVSADVIVETTEAELPVVPRSAIFRDEPGGTPYVFVKRGEQWERREVELGTGNHVFVAVRRGLEPGEVVAARRPEVRRETGAAD